MSRRIIITRSVQITEADLAEDVVRELQREGARNLCFDVARRVFENSQYDDVQDATIAKAEQRYGAKLQERHIKKVTAALEKKGYSAEIIRQDNKAKIIARKRVYA